VRVALPWQGMGRERAGSVQRGSCALAGCTTLCVPGLLHSTAVVCSLHGVDIVQA
jgi:hypothetical protein